MAPHSLAEEADVEGADMMIVTSNDHTLVSETTSEEKTAQIQIFVSDHDVDQADEDKPLFTEADDSERGEETPYTFVIPWAKGEKVLQEFGMKKFDYLPRQEPRVDYSLPESRCSPFSIDGFVQMKISRFEIAVPAFDSPDEICEAVLITCTRQEEQIGMLKAFIARRNPPSPVFSNHLLSIYKENGKLRRETLAYLKNVGSYTWGTELDVGDCMFIDTIGVLDDWEGLGIGRKMATMALESARELDIRWVFTYPHSWDHKERRAREGQLDLAINYWHSLGFRRVGKMDFCYSMDPHHPSHNLLPQEDFDPSDM